MSIRQLISLAVFLSSVQLAFGWRTTGCTRVSSWSEGVKAVSGCESYDDECKQKCKSDYSRSWGDKQRYCRKTYMYLTPEWDGSDLHCTEDYNPTGLIVGLVVTFLVISVVVYAVRRNRRNNLLMIQAASKPAVTTTILQPAVQPALVVRPQPSLVVQPQAIQMPVTSQSAMVQQQQPSFQPHQQQMQHQPQMQQQFSNQPRQQRVDPPPRYEGEGYGTGAPPTGTTGGSRPPPSAPGW